MTGVSEQVVLVGVDGSRASAAALRWAADEARRRDARLQVLRAWGPASDLFCAPYAPGGGRPTAVQRRAAAAESLAAQLRDVFGPLIGDGIQADLAEGAAERVLVDRSNRADLLVLGSAAPVMAVARPIGPVIRTCLSHARCPVVVVRAATQPELAGAAGLSADFGAGVVSARMVRA